ncbi:MAG: 23S rRNA (uracil(1939)-C(5))-methyltransferase RlmD [Candidatus Sericytochromatia bacterium]|nr:23S rRNA (uracil(1939)-C(5))-methyltransferase RlmD [Candidatus Tanganyikabacteria bacterium]
MGTRAVPVAVGDVVDLRIDEIVAGGEGLGRLGTYAIFVPYGAPGDVVRARVISTKPGYARALVSEILEPGPGRIAPPCRVYGACGGCQLQHLAYPEQLAVKEAMVRDALARIAKIATASLVRPIAGMAEPWFYRNKAHWAVSRVGNKLALGLFEPRSHKVVEPDPCQIQHPLLNLVLSFLRRELPAFGLAVYDERSGKGFLRSCFAKVAHATDELMIGLVGTTSRLPASEVFVAAVRESFPDARSVVLNVQPERSNVLLGPRTEVLWGEAFITERIGDASFRLSPRSFFQVNPLQTAVLYDHVRALAAPAGGETVVDAYCGTGTIALALAGAAGEVWGLESEPAAVADAQANARLNSVENAHFLAGRVEERLPKLIKDGLLPDVVVLDPPRRGCDPAVIAAIAQARPVRVVYVSCNPATLARDLAAFREAGYGPTLVQPVDMFPQTAHVEAVALLEPARKLP